MQLSINSYSDFYKSAAEEGVEALSPIAGAQISPLNAAFSVLLAG